MSDLALLSLIIGGELLLVSLLGFAWLATRQINGQRRARHALAALLERLRATEPDRLNNLRSFLTDKVGLAEADAPGAANDLLWGENRFYKRFVGIYLGRDDAQASRVDEAVDDLLGRYRSLPLTASAGANRAGEERAPEPQDEDYTAGAEGEDISSVAEEKVQNLIRKNKRLEVELGVTMETLSKVLAEYAFMYGNDDNAELATLDVAALTEMLRGPQAEESEPAPAPEPVAVAQAQPESPSAPSLEDEPDEGLEFEPQPQPDLDEAPALPGEEPLDLDGPGDDEVLDLDDLVVETEVAADDSPMLDNDDLDELLGAIGQEEVEPPAIPDAEEVASALESMEDADLDVDDIVVEADDAEAGADQNYDLLDDLDELLAQAPEGKAPESSVKATKNDDLLANLDDLDDLLGGLDEPERK